MEKLSVTGWVKSLNLTIPRDEDWTFLAFHWTQLQDSAEKQSVNPRSPSRWPSKNRVLSDAPCDGSLTPGMKSSASERDTILYLFVCRFLFLKRRPANGWTEERHVPDGCFRWPGYEPMNLSCSLIIALRSGRDDDLALVSVLESPRSRWNRDSSDKYKLARASDIPSVATWNHVRHSSRILSETNKPACYKIIEEASAWFDQKS